MVTKSELKSQIEKLTSDYLGFPVNVSGLSGMSKSELEADVIRLTKAVRFKKYANKINVDGLVGYFAAKGTQKRIDFERKSLIMRVATELWHNQPYEKAKQKARDYQGS